MAPSLFFVAPPENMLTPTTRLEAVNALLATIGLSPVDTIDADNPDAVMAEAALDAALREVCSQRWRFNTEYGYTIEPSGFQGGKNVFEAPQDLASFQLSRIPEQEGMDVIIRPSRSYQGGGKLIFYDRLNASEGFEVEELKIDPVWLLEFEHIPQPARNLVTVMAARSFQAQTKAAEILHAVTNEDVQRCLAGLVESERQVAPVEAPTDPSTELGAVNQLLVASGFPPVLTTDNPLTPQASEALAILRQAVREVCAEGWRFNTEFGKEIAASGSYEWTNWNGETYALNVFLAPSNLLSFTISKSPWQQGHRYLDLGLRTPTEISGLPEGTRVFWDRKTNREGLWDRETIYIDPVWLVGYDNLPEEAKHYALVIASRRFSGDASPFSPKDEAQAHRILRLAHGFKENHNILDNASVRHILGGRALRPSGVWDFRATGR